MPPLFGPDFNQREAVSLLLFIFMASINVVIVALLDRLGLSAARFALRTSASTQRNRSPEG
jgi:hypothetical protein